MAWRSLMLVACLALSGCAGSAVTSPDSSSTIRSTASGTTASPSGARGLGPRVVVESSQGEATVRVEVAATEVARERGLMERTTLASDAGMLFMFPREGEHTFWMENTPLSLDLVFVGEDGRVTSIIERARPKSREILGQGVLSRSVLEVGAGWVAAHRVRVGDRVRYLDVTGLP
jgi:uncharacterized membrane protein (UPF0127 family)